MKVIRDDIWLCSDCLMIAVNGDASGLDYQYSESESAARLAAIEAGLDGLGPHLVPDFNSEWGIGCEEEIGAYVTRRPCDCCGCQLHGSRYRFALLGE